MKTRSAALKLSRAVDLITFQSLRMLIANSKRVAEGPSSNPVHGCLFFVGETCHFLPKELRLTDQFSDMV